MLGIHLHETPVRLYLQRTHFLECGMSHNLLCIAYESLYEESPDSRSYLGERSNHRADQQPGLDTLCLVLHMPWLVWQLSAAHACT